jgi:glycerol-3-phosphate dehydrogenase
LTGAEVDYLMRREWAQTADDVLWRRGKLGLLAAAAECDALAAYMAAAPARSADLKHFRPSAG